MKKCDSLDEVRSEIDVIDIKIVELISERSHLIHQAAGFKNSVEEVKAEDRIDFILQRVRHKAIELGINPNMLSELFEYSNKYEELKIIKNKKEDYKNRFLELRLKNQEYEAIFQKYTVDQEERNKIIFEQQKTIAEMSVIQDRIYSSKAFICYRWIAALLRIIKRRFTRK